MKPTNPFIIQGYQGKAYFCNRKEEIQLLEEHTLNNRNFTIYGWRRLGKTSLLHCLAAELREKHNISTIFVDISACRDLKSFKLKFLNTVFEKYGQTKKGSIKTQFQKIISSLGLSIGFDSLSGLPNLSFNLTSNNNSSREQSIEKLLDYLSEIDQKILIVLDEFQQIQNFKEDHIEALLRGYTQDFPQLRFAFSGSHRGIIQSMFANHNRPFYKSTQLVDLKPIKISDYTEFIKTHFENHNKTIDQELIHQIYDWCRGETYSIQLVCNHLFSNFQRPNESNFIEVTQHIIQQQHRMYVEFQNLLTYNQIKLLKAIAKNEPVKHPNKHEFIINNDLGAASSVQTALKALIDKEIIFVEDELYYIHDVLFTRWLQKN